MVLVVKQLNRWVFVAIGVDGVLLFVSVLYFVFVTRYPTVTFISDLLFCRFDYKVIVSVLVFCQIGTTFVFALSQINMHPIKFIFVFFSLAMATVGWCMVAFVHISDDRKIRNTSFIHMTGAELYVSGHTASYACMIMDTWHRYQISQTLKHFCFCILVLVCFLQCGTFGVLFTITASAWVYEQLLFISFHVAHLVFFVNILQDDHDSIEYLQEFNMFRDIQLQPSAIHCGIDKRTQQM